MRRRGQGQFAQRGLFSGGRDPLAAAAVGVGQEYAPAPAGVFCAGQRGVGVLQRRGDRTPSRRGHAVSEVAHGLFAATEADQGGLDGAALRAALEDARGLQDPLSGQSSPRRARERQDLLAGPQDRELLAPQAHDQDPVLVSELAEQIA